MARRLMRYSLIPLLGLMAVTSTAVAEALRDPTRPPAASAKVMAGKPEHSGWILQSVLISPERRYAIINDEVVAIGGSIAGAQLVAVAEERVTLRTQDGLRIVHLFPDVTRLASDAGPGMASRSSPPAEPSIKAQRAGETGKKK